MSKISFTGNSSGTGNFQFVSPNSNTDRTFNLPDENGQVLTDASNVAADKLTGDIAPDRITGALNATGSAPIYACRAWVNFDGTGTVSVRGSGNVSSVVDNGVGAYLVNFTENMIDNKSSSVISGKRDNNTFLGLYQASGYVVSGSSIGVRSQKTNQNSPSDLEIVCVAIFR